MRDISATAVKCAAYVIEANFYISVALVILGGACSLTDNYSIFEFNVAIYNELANDLRVIMGYLGFTEVMVFFLCLMTKQYKFYLLVGFFLLMMIGSVEFYGQLNTVEIDPNIDIWLFYAGVSHILFGAMVFYQAKRQETKQSQ
jgi:hypothetical protein